MSTHRPANFDPQLDLVLERTIDVPPELVWKAWTQPEHLKPWFCPKPWQVVDCRIDLRPGGEFFTMMRGPEGQEFGDPGCFLEVVEGRKLVFTDGLAHGFRPKDGAFMTAIIEIEPDGKGGTKYTAIALHKSTEDQEKHEAMGFTQGWGTALDQLVEYVKGL